MAINAIFLSVLEKRRDTVYIDMKRKVMMLAIVLGKFTIDRS